MDKSRKMPSRRCRQKRSRKAPLNNSSTTHTPDFPEDQIALIHAGSRHIQGLISQLHEEHASLFCRLNTIQSATRSLPPEILSLIFQHACHPPSLFDNFFHICSQSGIRGPTFHLILGGVSSHWRQVVLSTPQLWSFCGIVLSPGILKKGWGILQASLERSAAVPLHLAFGPIDLEIDDRGNVVSPKFDTMLLNNQHRIRSLRLQLGGEQFTKWIPNLSNLTGLTSLSIKPRNYISRDPVKFPILPNTPLLLDIPWVTITTLDLSLVPIDACVKLLVGCPNLVSFRIHYPSDPQGFYDGRLLTECVTLPKLELLSWEFLKHPHSSWNSDFLKYIRAPNLKTLCWSERRTCAGGDWDPLYATSFLNNLPITIKHLEFSQMVTDSRLLGGNNLLLRSFPRHSHIESITLSDFVGDFWRDFLHSLWIVNANGENGVTAIFPYLKVIRFPKFWSGRCDEAPDPVPLEAEVIIHPGTGDSYSYQFILEVSKIMALQWLGLRKVIKSDFNVVLKHNGTRLALP